MMVRATFTVLAAVLAGAASAQDSSQQAQLGVTATVVRPAEVSVFPPSTDSAIAIVRDTASVDVVADGGTVERRGDDTAVVAGNGSTSVTVTLIF